MKRPLRIVSVCRNFPSPDDPSGGTFVLNRVAAMAQQADVHVLHAVPHFPLLKPLPDWARDESRTASGVRIEHAAMFYLPGVLKSLDGTWLARAVAGPITRLHREQPIDLVDAHFGYPEGVGCAAVARRLNLPLFVTIRGFEMDFVDRPLIGTMMLETLKNAKGVVAVSESLKRFAVERGVPDERICVIHNAIDGRAFSYGERDAARQALGIDMAGPLIVSVGHLVPIKRHNVLIEAFAAVAQRLPGARLAIVGSSKAGPAHAQALRSQVAALGLCRHVNLVGSLPSDGVVNWLRAADVFALASAREGCCNAILEALAVGVPVVATSVGDNAVFVKQDRSGVLVPVDDAQSLGAALLTALQRGDWDRRLIAAELRAKVGDWPEVGRRVIDFFQGCLQER